MKWVRNNYIWVFIGVFVLFLIVFRLNSLTAGISQLEYANMTRGLGWHGIFADILFLPLKILRSIIAVSVGTDHTFVNRFTSSIFGLITAGLFAFIVASWHDKRTAALTTLLFICSPLFLGVSRVIGFDVLLISVIPVIFAGNVLLRKYPESNLVFYMVLISWVYILTIPGGVWFVLLNAWLKRQDIIDTIKDLNGFEYVIIVFLAFLTLLPISLVFIGQTNLLSWLGLPTTLDSLTQAAKHFALTPYYLLLHPVRQPEIWLERAPLLNIFNLFMFIVGAVYYVKHWAAGRSKQIIAFFILSLVLIGFKGKVSMALVMPLLYLVIASGLNYISRLWFKTFPINPLARFTGHALIFIAVSLSCLYGIRTYFVAWPHNEQTKSLFRIKS